MSRYILSGMLGRKPIRFELAQGTQTLGRSSNCEIVLPDPAVSKQHAEVSFDGSRIMVRDLKSRNGTFINDIMVEEQKELHNGDHLRLGHLLLKLKDQEHSSITRLSPESSTQASFSTSIDEARTLSGVQRSDVVIGAVHEAGQILSRRMNLEELNETLLDLLGQFIRSDRILLISPDEENGEPVTLASRAAGSNPDEPLRMSRTMLKEVLEKRRSFLTKDASADERFSAQESIISAGVHSAMAAPLFDNDKILGVVYVDSRNPLITYSNDELQLLTLLANMMAVKMTNSRLEQAEEERQRLKNELDVGRRIQKNLLPQTLPQVSGYQIFAYQAPCYEVGGDLYDLRARRDGRVWLVLGDVTGKGIGAALLMATAMAGLQFMEDELADPLVLTNRLHKFMSQHVDMGQFLTLFAGLLDPATGEIHYVNAGHNPPYILSGTERRELESTGRPVALLPNSTWEQASVVLAPGESLVVFSDGLSEATDPRGDQYDEGRMQELLGECTALSGEDLGKRLLADNEMFRAGEPAADDLTLFVVRRG